MNTVDEILFFVILTYTSMQIEILDVNVVMCVDRLALVINVKIVDYLNERKKKSESLLE